VKSPRNGAQRNGNNAATAARNGGAIWILDAAGKLERVRVTVGITDGQRTQIDSPSIKEGMQVIVGSTQAATATSSSPFQSQQPSGPRPPGTF